MEGESDKISQQNEGVPEVLNEVEVTASGTKVISENALALWEKAKLKIKAISSFMSIPQKKKVSFSSAQNPISSLPRVPLLPRPKSQKEEQANDQSEIEVESINMAEEKEDSSMFASSNLRQQFSESDMFSSNTRQTLTHYSQSANIEAQHGLFLQQMNSNYSAQGLSELNKQQSEDFHGQENQGEFSKRESDSGQDGDNQKDDNDSNDNIDIDLNFGDGLSSSSDKQSNRNRFNNNNNNKKNNDDEDNDLDDNSDCDDSENNNGNKRNRNNNENDSDSDDNNGNNRNQNNNESDSNSDSDNNNGNYRNQKYNQNDSSSDSDGNNQNNQNDGNNNDNDDDDFEDDEDEDENDGGDQGENSEQKAAREAEDLLFIPEVINVDDSTCDGEKQASSEQTGNSSKETQGMRIVLMDDNQMIRVDFHGREYTIDLRNESVQANPKLLRIVNEITDLIELGQSKLTHDVPPELANLAPFNYLTAIEYYLMKALHEMSNTTIKWQDEICCICQCDLFEDIDNYTHDKFVEQLTNSSDDDPVNLYQCEAHFFHRSCLKSMITNSFVKCPICCKIYGVMIGDQPPGQMRVSLNNHARCDGYPNSSTIVISMQMHKTQKNGNFVPSTGREGYLPNTAEARVVLDMIKTAFKRKLIFTIGRSVTTGQDNRIVWNGVHFKTNTSGGSANFGYPDPTYLQRITQELALKGIYPKQEQ